MKHNAKPCSNARRVTCMTEQPLLTVKGKVKVKSLYLTSVVPSVTRLVSMEADGAPFTPLPLSVICFTGIQIYVTRIRGQLKQTFRSLMIKPETSRYESRALAN